MAKRQEPREAPPQLLTLPQCAAKLACSVREIRKLIERGKLHKTTWNRTPRVSEADLYAFVMSVRRVGPRRP